jgi:hypothetical protein
MHGKREKLARLRSRPGEMLWMTLHLVNRLKRARRLPKGLGGRMPRTPPKPTGLSMLPTRGCHAKPTGTIARACWRRVERHARRLLARRRARPGPAFAAMREFNDPARRCPRERQRRDPRGRWGQGA